MTHLAYPFLKKAGKIVNSDQARTLLMTGNVHDLFALTTDGEVDYVPLIDFLCASWRVRGRIVIVYELNGPVRFIRKGDKEKIRDAWLRWQTGFDADTLAIEKMMASGKIRARFDSLQKAFDDNLIAAVGNPTVALELLRQICLCARTEVDGAPGLTESLIILIEAADMLMPEGEISRLSDADRHRVSICQDWFSDPGFMNSNDTVALITESRSLINQRVARLPQVIEVRIDAPDTGGRKHFIQWFDGRRAPAKKLQTWGSIDELAQYTAGLSIHALMQLLKGAVHDNRRLMPQDVILKVEAYIQSQLGEDIVEFKKPTHKFDDLVGFTNLKRFLRQELIPRFKAGPSEALPGAAVCGPIGGGKTYIFEALASELDMIVLVLKNLRSQWFGQTDVILERLKRVLDALSRAVIFVDEADTQFGGVGPDTHETERRLTGKIQAMMSDTRQRGRIFWLLMTARIHRLSPDIRRPGRVGDLIIPVLDPEGEDRNAFIRWAVSGVLDGEPTADTIAQLKKQMGDYSAAGFASLRSELKAKSVMKGGLLSSEEIQAVIDENLPPAIGDTRRYQLLQALLNCTRKSLLPGGVGDAAERHSWESELRQLEAKGIR